jgi:hypothetical protein
MSAELGVEVPPAVVRVTSTAPADSAGEVAVHDVVELQLKTAAGTPPNLAVVALTRKPEPVMVTTVPPPRGPAAGLTLDTTGATS